MIRILSSEWLKIRSTRTVFWLLAVLVGLAMLIVIAGVLASKKTDLAGSDNQLGFIRIGVLAPVIALIMGLIVSTGEFRHSTITPTLLATPRRGLVVLGKAVAAMLLGIALVAVVELISLGLTPLLISARGIDVQLRTGEVMRVIAHLLVVAAIWGALGSAVGLAFRNQIGTVVGCLAWLLVIENIIVALLHSSAVNSDLGAYLPFRATAAFAFGGSDKPMLSHWAGLAMLCAWLVVASGGAFAILSRRDVS
ncbi:MAG: ABC transporter permease [Gaiellaceae bacterium]